MNKQFLALLSLSISSIGFSTDFAAISQEMALENAGEVTDGISQEQQLELAKQQEKSVEEQDKEEAESAEAEAGEED